MRARPLVLAAVVTLGDLLALPGCRRSPAGAPGERRVSGAAREGKELLEAGQLDAALAALQKSPDDPDSLFYQGRVWAKKAETAPLPPAPPAPQPPPRGYEPPPPPEFKPEELQAAGFYERAIAAKPEAADAHLALAELLAPHAAHQYDLQEEAARRKHPLASPSALPVDTSADRVVRAYQAALQADPSSTVPVQELIRFGRRVNRLDAAEAGFKEMVRRKKEAQTAEPLVKYGDFLADEKKDPLAAIDEYRQALIWKPDDDATRSKVADIYLKMAAEAFAQQQYAVADERLKDSAPYIPDRTSVQARTLEDYKARLKNIRR